MAASRNDCRTPSGDRYQSLKRSKFQEVKRKLSKTWFQSNATILLTEARIGHGEIRRGRDWPPEWTTGAWERSKPVYSSSKTNPCLVFAFGCLTSPVLPVSPRSWFSNSIKGFPSPHHSYTNNYKNGIPRKEQITANKHLNLWITAKTH